MNSTKNIYKILPLCLMIGSLSVYSAVNSTQSKLKTSTLKKVLSNFSFNYFAQYTGPSLDSRYKQGTTYNRFDGGTSQEGKRYDATGSTSLYQSFKLGYKLPKDLIISYGVTFQRNVTDDAEYSQTSGTKAFRDNGTSYNNHRVSLWIPSVLSGNRASLSLSLFYELPTETSTNTINETALGGANFDEVVASNETEVDMEYQYGIGIQPTLSIYSNVKGLFHGLTASYERYIFPEYVKEYEKNPFWCERSNNCNGVKKDQYTYQAQGTKFSLGAYANYALTDKLTLKSSVEFDWDQVGDQVGSLNDWGNNMDNIGNTSLAYRLNNKIAFEAGLNFSLEEAGLDKTALVGAFSLSL
jgi:hypothetical protein